MVEKVIFTPEASNDVSAAYDWYAPQKWRKRLGHAD